MNVCFYTRSAPSIPNLLNISYLVNQRPHHNYSFINVAHTGHKPSLKDRLRNFYAQARFDDGRYDFPRDTLAVAKELQGHVQRLNLSAFESAAALAVNDLASEQFLDKVTPDVIIQAGAGILKENIFSRAKIATINLHHGIAPEIRGIDSTFWCMFYGIKEKIGVTCHLIDQHLDTGAVIIQDTLKTTTGSFINVQTANYLMGRDVLVKSIDVLENSVGTQGLKIVSKGQIKSYYFGLPDNFLYYALKKRHFNPIMKISQKTYKMKDANFVMIPE